MKRVDRRMDELREEIGVSMNLAGRLVKSWLRWAGDFLWMQKEKMGKRADRLRGKSRRTTGEMGGLCEE